MNRNQRPGSLAEVAEWSATWDELSYHLKDFLHEFERQPALSMLETPPRLLVSTFEGGAVCDAYLAATAATLAVRIGGTTPEWATQPERYLRKPWFASPGAAMRACLLLESPARFRERNLFVTANALSVA